MVELTLLGVIIGASLIISLGIFLHRIIYLIRIMRVGKPEYRFDRIPQRLWGLVKYVLGQRSTVRSDRLGGVTHVFIFWGFLLLIPEVIDSIGTGLSPEFSLAFLGAGLYAVLRFLQEVGSGMVLVGIGLALFRRYIIRPEKLENTSEALLILVLILLVVLTTLGYTAFQLTLPTASSEVMPISQLLAGWVKTAGMTESTRRSVMDSFLTAHVIVLLSFMAFVPYTRKHLHLAAVVPNVFMRSLKPRGELTYIDLEKEETLGAGRIDAFGWKQLLDVYTCTECGRCQDNCPANLTKKPLNPKKLILDIKHNLMQNGKLLTSKNKEQPSPLITDPITEDVLWSCTTCAACVDQCPVFIEHVHKIVEMRRYLTLTEGKVPEAIAKAFKEMEYSGNPWGFPSSERGEWIKPLAINAAEDETPEVLFFAGCFASYDERNRMVASSVVRLLKAGGVKFVVLGDDEACCGDPARRMGNEFLFQTLAQENIRKFKELKVKKILTACPHCFNTFKNEYPQLGGKFEVMHHTQFLRDMLNNGKLKISKPLNLSVTLHDSCYLGRYNGIYAEPREILGKIPNLQLKEMKRNQAISFCCGAGGGRIWMEEELGERINVNRTQQALSLGVSSIVTACPFCLNMLEDGLKTLGKEESVLVQDLTELLEKSL